MKRIKLLSSPYSYASTWIGAVLFATRSRYGGGWDVRFPHPVGCMIDSDEGAKNVWFHCDNRVKVLKDIPSINKPRFTLVTSPDSGEQVWALIKTGTQVCTGCSLRGTSCVGKAPPCTAKMRPDNREVIFITAVEKW